MKADQLRRKNPLVFRNIKLGLKSRKHYAMRA